jgi:hypothetical protein
LLWRLYKSVPIGNRGIACLLPLVATAVAMETSSAARVISNSSFTIDCAPASAHANLGSGATSLRAEMDRSPMLYGWRNKPLMKPFIHHNHCGRTKTGLHDAENFRIIIRSFKMRKTPYNTEIIL